MERRVGYGAIPLDTQPLAVGSFIFSGAEVGSSEFVKDAINNAEEKAKDTSRLKSEIMDLGSLANKICGNEGVEKEELLTGSKKKVVVKCRKIFCQIAIKKMGYSGADVARFLGVTTSAVNRLAVSEKLPDVDKYT